MHKLIFIQELAAASTNADREMLALKIKILEGSMDENSSFLSPERTSPPKGDKHAYSEHKAAIYDLDQAKENAVAELATLLHVYKKPEAHYGSDYVVS